MKHYLEDFDILLNQAFIKIADVKMDAQIPVPNGVAEIAKDAYDNRYSKDVNFGDSDMFEIGRMLKNRSAVSLKLVLEIHKYTVKHRFTHSDSKKHRTYWEYRLHGGELGRKWSESIIRSYLPKEVRN